MVNSLSHNLVNKGENLEHCYNLVISIPSEVLWIMEGFWITALAWFDNFFNQNQ